MADVALITERRYVGSVAAPDDWYFGNVLREDGLLAAALDRLGLNSVRVDWNDPGVDWARFRVGVFRTTWDYFDNFAAFSAWLPRVRQQTRLCNPADLVAWNLDKHYLADLAGRGLPVVRSRFLERGSVMSLAHVLRATGWDDAVVKPCVSGAARHTYRVHHANAAEVDRLVQPLLAAEAFLLQPFERGIVTQGEDSLMVFAGRYSHAVRKVPKAGDFRVQDDHGGTLRVYQPSRDQIDLAERVVAACSPRPAYARVDMVQTAAGCALMELELIEPELWMRVHPESAAAFAAAIAQAIG